MYSEVTLELTCRCLCDVKKVSVREVKFHFVYEPRRESGCET